MTAAYQDGQYDTDLVAEAREPKIESGVCYDFPNGGFDYQETRDLLNRLADALESRTQEVSALREVIEKAREVLSKSLPSSRREGLAILLTAPAVASPETKNEGDN